MGIIIIACLLLFFGLIFWAEIRFGKLSRKQIRNGAIVILSILLLLAADLLLPSFARATYQWLHRKTGSVLPDIVIKAGIVLLFVLLASRIERWKRRV